MAPDPPTAAPPRSTTAPVDRPPQVIWPEPPGPVRWGLTVAALAVMVVVLIGAGTLAVSRLLAAPPGAGRERAWPVAVAGAERSVVDVESQLGWRGIGAAGTGLVLGSGGEVVTNNHVIAQATDITVTVVGTGRSYPAVVVGYDVAADLAVLRVRGAGRLVPAVPSAYGAHIGQTVTAIGNAGGLGGRPAVSTGLVTGVGQSITALDQIAGTVEKLSGLIATTAVVASGESGGPLVDRQGRVVAIDAAGSGDRRVPAGGVRGFAIPIARVLAVAAQIEAGRPAPGLHIGPTAFLGVEATDALAPAPGAAAPATGPAPRGAIIYSVYPGTPAAAAGIQPGDTIVSLDRRPVASAEAVRAVTERRRPGSLLEVGWVGPTGDRHTARITLTVGPPD